MSSQPPTAAQAGQVASAIVAFTLEGRFPDNEETASLPVSATDLGPAIGALEGARAELEAEIEAIDHDTKDDVAGWVQSAKTLQDDIVRSKTWAAEIVRQSEAPAASGRDIAAAEERIEFIAREAQYADQLCWVLEGIRDADTLLGAVEARARADNGGRIVEALHLLEQAWAAMDRIPVAKSCRVMRLLSIRSFELKSTLHDEFDRVWKALVEVDVDAGRVTIRQRREGVMIGLDEAVVGLKAYKEVDERMEQLWHNLDGTIVGPRMRRDEWELPRLVVGQDTIQLQGGEPPSIDALLNDMKGFLVFLSSRLPADLLESLSTTMMADLVPRLVHVWLDAEVPSSLQEMDRFQQVIASAGEFCTALEATGFSAHVQPLREWVENAPSIWLSKCRETALESVRAKLTAGISGSKQVERVERRVKKVEGDVDWNAGWGDEEGEEEEQVASPGKPDSAKGLGSSVDGNKPGGVEEDAADWGWGDDDGGGEGENKEDPSEAKKQEQHQPEQDAPQDEDDGAEWDIDWDTNDADNSQQASQQSQPKEPQHELKQPQRQPKQPQTQAKKVTKVTKATPSTQTRTREVVLREQYMISSMPEPVLELIFAILEDGVALTQTGNETNPVAAAAGALFSLPTLALSLFRAISPHYYSKDIGGNMYLYNDATYLAEQLSAFSAAWHTTRTDIPPHARSMLRLDADVSSLRAFANRSYSNELALQKTILRDLLGGAYSLMSQSTEADACVDSAVARVLSMAGVWEEILAPSAWAQAVGALADAVAKKVVADVLDMAAIGQDEAFRIAGLIAAITELDAVFLPSRLSRRGGASPQKQREKQKQKEKHASGNEDDDQEEEEIPQTAQYAPSWLRLKYLSEMLQANLMDVRYLWFESELSLWFSADEVVDLIGLSFEANERARGVVREIEGRPRPLE